MIYLLPLLSVVIGYIMALILKPENRKNLKLLLAFSGSFLLALTVLHILPEVYESTLHSHGEGHEHEHLHNNSIGLYIMAGIIFQIILEYFSKGAEHGHVHIHKHEHGHEHGMPWLLFISLCLHALLEGMPVSHHHDMAWGIAIHHFPIAIILTAFFINSGLNKIAVMLFMLAFAAMTPLGTLLSGQLECVSHYYTEISAVVVGILFHISSTIIFESGENHKFNLAKLLAIILGVIMAYYL
ncbi:ZIP family metal transporter [Flavobacterium sp. Sd200]|uniref:ZIP family metal transporter n=1 Tax=Flavobacterium sp. Sd200 TaxID=2692211 RepID=UPI001372017B|nr:ZIP family metal transporter [Flavobacterium sp. Sd200]MXN90338.1 ZIP family metal transporter [Flavobacterium sp. Sd200]